MFYIFINMYCLPAVIYVGLHVVGVFYALLEGTNSIGFAFFHLIFIWIFAWFLDYLCRNGYTVASWILVLFPFIFMFALVFGVLMTMKATGSPAPTLTN